MSNSSLVTYTNLTKNHSGKRNHKIDTVTIHCYVGQVTAKQGCDYFATTDRQASSNYVVGYDGSIGLSVEETNRSWCSSNSANDHRAITIEVASDATAPYAVTDKAYAALIDLLVDICTRNGIEKLKWWGDKSLIGNTDLQNMTVHRWFANKDCPGEYLYNLHGQIAREVNARLNKEEDDMDLGKFKELWYEMRKELQDNDSSQYSAEAREWAVANGLITGSSAGEFNGMWQDMMTREQFVTVLYRFAQLMGKA